MQEAIQALQTIINNSQHLVFFGGAGVSTESGIPDFRSAQGVYSQDLGRNFSAEQLISHSMYVKYPQLFYDFYRKHLIYPHAKPNAAHNFLARLEASGHLDAVITQNIDTLHEAAGSQGVLKLHGTVDRNICQECGRVYDLKSFLDAYDSQGIPRCPHCGGVLKPDVTLYEESLNMEVFDKAISAIQRADTLIVGGTSLVVYPAAGLLQYFKGKHLVVINKEAIPQDDWADLVIHAPIGQVFSQLVLAEQ